MVPPTLGRILVVDDAPSVVRGLVWLLRRDGYQVETARNGRHALAQLQGRHYDVILSDFHMPEMDGRAFYAHLRQQATALHQRVIFLTGADGADAQAFLTQCGQPWLRKPCRMAAIRRAIAQVLQSAGPMSLPEQPGNDRTARCRQLWHKSQGLRRKSAVLTDTVQTLRTQSTRLRVRAALLKGSIPPLWEDAHRHHERRALKALTDFY